jgi:hypothetical protein
MKKKAIHAEYRKTSESFPDWLKYEITILNEDGTTEKVPAYGKDLQDALSRVVHDEKVEKLTEKTNFIPWWGWVIIWFSYLSVISFWWRQTGNTDVLGIGILSAMTLIVILMFWGRERNLDKRQS